jgi:hypothetical protein
MIEHNHAMADFYRSKKHIFKEVTTAQNEAKAINGRIIALKR